MAVFLIATATEREACVQTLRSLCREFGDNEWDETLHLQDVIEKHLNVHLQARDEVARPVVEFPATSEGADAAEAMVASPPAKMQCKRCASTDNIVAFNIKEKLCIDCLTKEVLELREKKDVPNFSAQIEKIIMDTVGEAEIGNTRPLETAMKEALVFAWGRTVKE